MDQDQTLRALNIELSALARQRRHQLKGAERASLEIGARTQYLRDHLGQSKAASAQLAGVSPSHLTEWMTRAGSEDIALGEPHGRVPFLAGGDLTTFVLTHGGLRRIIASHAEHDCFFLSGLDPQQLRSGDGLIQPRMMVQTLDGEWAAVANVDVGHGGTESENAVRALLPLGLDADLVADLVRFSASDVRFGGGSDPVEPPLHSRIHPAVPLRGPSFVRGAWVVRLAPVDLLEEGPMGADHQTVALHSDLWTHGGGGSHLQRWIEYLDSQVGEWCEGSRRARFYFDEAVAEAHGFQSDPSASSALVRQRPYTAVIEQGRMQLWIALPVSTDPAERFVSEVHEVLRLMGFFDDLEALDNRSAFWTWLSRLGEFASPGYVDLGGEPLRSVPSCD